MRYRPDDEERDHFAQTNGQGQYHSEWYEVNRRLLSQSSVVIGEGPSVPADL
jgi:hypothetical protein